jgi:hypothetical protein
MYNAANLKTSLAGLVGISQAYDPTYQAIRSFLTESSSGVYVETTHPLCSIDNLLECAPLFADFTYPAWVNQAYQKGFIVSNHGKKWRARKTIALGAAQDPNVGSLDVNEYGAVIDEARSWDEYDPFAEWVRDRYNAAIVELVGDIVRFKRLDHANRTLLDSIQLFDGMGALINRIIKRSRFVGFEIKLASQQGLAVTIDKIGMQLDAAQSLNLYLFHSSVEDAIAVIPITFDKANTFNFKSPTDAVIMNHFTDTHDLDGVYYLGYYEDDLTGQAIKRDSNWGTAPCYGCTGWNYSAWQRWSKHVGIRAIAVSSTYLNADPAILFDANGLTYDNSTNFGMNISLTVACDLTAFMVQNKMRIADALAMKTCIKFLHEIAYSTRMNAIPDKIKSLAIADLSNTDKDSFLNKYQDEIKSVSLEFSGMSSDCMPCADTRKISVKAI